MSIGDKLIALRKKKGLTQEEVAKKLKVTRKLVSEWEDDKAVPGMDMVSPICELYNITSNELLSEQNTEKEFKEEVKECKDKCKDEFSLYGQLKSIFSLLTLIIYLFISFITMAWHLTWIIWIIFALIMEIVKLIVF